MGLCIMSSLASDSMQPFDARSQWDSRRWLESQLVHDAGIWDTRTDEIPELIICRFRIFRDGLCGHAHIAIQRSILSPDVVRCP